jgi:predicted enzyme related to lactoylglutathione lyase
LPSTKAFYVDAVGFGVLAQWEDHEGYDGVVLSIGNATRQLELLQQHGVLPAPTSEDQIVLYLGSIESVDTTAERIRQAGHEPVRSPNPYWKRDGALCFIDPDGYWLILSPSSWA